MIGAVFVGLVLLPPVWLLVSLMGNPVPIVIHWLENAVNSSPETDEVPPVASQLLAYLIVGLLGFVATNHLIPSIKLYTLKKGISGKDLGKKGTALENKDIPEALGIVSGSVFLVCLILCLVGYATSHPSKLLDCNSALLSICFMLFLGFTDDVLDWPWRYKLVLPSVASLPLLCTYAGSTSIVVPIHARPLLFYNSKLTIFSWLLSFLITVDKNSEGCIVDLGIWYFLYMGMLAVFCTNAINIYAGINGLEAGQSFVIGCAVLLYNLIEIENSSLSWQNHLFSVMIMLSFLGVTTGLLRHNWYPADVFVGDTFCYFAGMTFAVVGILGHFSKTLLLFFIPQIFNFLWSTPQLFHFVPCPRHRLPKFNSKTGLMEPSTFPCEAGQFRVIKRHPDDTTCPNMTVINLCLQILGPMREETLCVTLLALQVLCCGFGFFGRYYLAQFFFDR